MLKLYLWIRNMLEGEEGQDLAEYSLLLVTISVVAIAAMILVGDEIITVFTAVTTALTPPYGP